MIVGLSGYAQTGKDTVANILVERGFQRTAFADVLKDVLQDVNPIISVRSGDRGPRLADHLEHGWEYAKKNPEVRELLQRLGVACREHIRDDVWVRAVMEKVVNGGEHWVISDVRFRNEADAVKINGGRVWRVERPGYGPVNGHISETALDGYQPNLRLANSGNLEALKKLVLMHIPYDLRVSA